MFNLSPLIAEQQQTQQFVQVVAKSLCFKTQIFNYKDNALSCWCTVTMCLAQSLP